MSASELTWRPLTQADIPEWQRVLAETEAVEKTGENYSADDLAEEFDDPNLVPDRDTIAAFDGDRMVAVGAVSGQTTPRDTHRLNAWAAVHPEYRGRGIGRELLGRQMEQAKRQHTERHSEMPALWQMGAFDHVPDRAALARAAGLEPIRHWFEMERNVEGPVPTPGAAPDGLRITAYEPALDDALRIAHNEAFAQHFGSSERDPETWRHWFTGSRSFNGDISFLAVTPDDEVASYVLGYEYEADTEANGYREAYVGQVGTRPAFRGNGLASILFGHALAAFHAAGYRSTSLGVDAANGTGALGLYERLGYEVRLSSTTFAAELTLP